MSAMESTSPSSLHHPDIIEKEAPKLVGVLKEMKDGLDSVRNKIQILTAKVKADQYPTADGISYLDAKYLLLLNYCQCLVYYLLRKAKGLPIDGHPVVRSLVEIRLFLEKVRGIDKKLQYQLQKVTTATGNSTETANEKKSDSTEKTEDLLRYRPNPDMLISKSDMTAEDETGVYKPPKFAPAIMEEGKMSKQERNALRKEELTLRRASKNAIMKDLMDEVEGRPEEVRETFGIESKEFTRFRETREERDRREEELFTRAPLTKMEKKREKHLKKSRNGLSGLTESFFDDIKSLPLGDDGGEELTGFSGGSSTGAGRYKKRKRRH